MLIDSNILIYALNTSSPKHIAAQLFLQSQSKDITVAQQNIFETLRVLTHPKFPSPFPLQRATMAIQAVTDYANVICPTIETPAIAFRLIEKYKITGAEVFDAYLVATALSNGISSLATDNVKHLKKYAEIQIVNPFE